MSELSNRLRSAAANCTIPHFSALFLEAAEDIERRGRESEQLVERLEAAAAQASEGKRA